MNIGDIEAGGCKANEPFDAAAALTAALHYSIHE